MNTWRQRINDRKLLVTDGAWGTEFAKRGLPAGEAPERWNIERPDDVRAVAAAYARAGADIVLTNTFGGSRCKLEKAGLGSRAAEINRLGVELSRQATGRRALVFASVGPTGEFMAPVGLIDEVNMTRFFEEQIQWLAAGGADGIVVETMTDLNEAKAALRAAKSICDLPVAVSMSFDRNPRGYFTMMGVTPSKASEELTTAGADIVGVNCGGGMAEAIEIVRLMRKATSLPLWAKPNAGLPELKNGQTVFRETPEAMAARLPDLVEAGAHHIGGCCGTTSRHIELFAAERQTLVNLTQALF